MLSREQKSKTINCLLGVEIQFPYSFYCSLAEFSIVVESDGNSFESPVI